MASGRDIPSKTGRSFNEERDQRAGSSVAVRSYTNHLTVRCSLAEVLLDFGQHYPAPGSPVPVSSLVTSPVHLALFQQQLTGALARYEAEYGALPVSPTEPDLPTEPNLPTLHGS